MEPMPFQFVKDSATEPIAGSPEAMRTFLREDRERWARVIKEHNIKVDQ